MSKHFPQFFFIVVGSLVVIVVSLFARQYLSGQRFSAGALLNYPFVSKTIDEVESLVENEPKRVLDRSTIFADKPREILKCKGCMTLLVTGDVLPARSVNQKTTSSKDFTWPFAKTADFLRSADLTMINLETPLVPNCNVRTDGMVFCGDQRNVEGLKFAGVDVVNYANNHAGNAGKNGVTETVKLLEGAGFVVSGVNQPVYKTVNGVRYAFLGYNDVEKYGFIDDVDKEKMSTKITQTRQNADVVIVQFHWGEEYRYQPTSRQKDLARFVIDQGADLVVGNHPHWIEPLEWYKDKLIVYSHGNFVFDQMWSTETRLGMVGRYTFQDKQLVDVAFFPIKIEEYGQPRWLEGKEKRERLEVLERESGRLVK